MRKRTNNKGFTLVELLVVIAVISFTIAVLFPNFMGARQRGRDVQRKSDLSQMQKAIELFKLDQNPQSYPTTGAFGTTLCNKCWSTGADCSGTVYMRKFPCDPGSLAPTPYIYTRNTSDPLKYTVSACLENLVDPDRDTTPVPTCGASATSYTIYEP